MTTPTLTVLLDDGTSTFPLNVSSKVMALDGYDITRGRDDWQGAVTAGELSLTLNNSDGRFTPGSTILGTPSPIKVDQKIRLKETVNGVTYTRFTGYVKSWPVAWPATVTTFSTVQLTATDAQARAERWTLRSLAQQEILAASLAAYHPLSEATGSTAAGDLTGQQTPLLPSVTAGFNSYAFGTDLGLPDGSTGATLTQGSTTGAGGLLGKDGTAVPGVATWTDTSAFISIVFLQNGGAGAQTPIASLHFAAGVGFSGITFDSTGHAIFNGCTSPTSLMDGLPHVISVQAGSGLSTDLWVDGVKVDTAAVMANTWDNASVLLESPGLASVATTFAHFAYGSRISDAQVQDIQDALLTELAGESGTDRITRIAGYSGIPLGTLDSSLNNVAGQATDAASAQTAIQEVADSEMGLVFINGNGSLTFHNRSRVAGKTTPDLTLDRQWVTPDVQPVVDDQQIVNYLEATAAGTGAPSIAEDTASQTSHGRYPVSQTYLVQTNDEAQDRASWIVSRQAEPTPRYGTLTINLFGMTPALASSVVAALDLNCWLRVTSLASQNPGGATADVVVQGWRASVTAESWSITCNVVARSLFNAWILGDATYGVLGSTTTLNV
jgi:hypothetical protein